MDDANRKPEKYRRHKSLRLSGYHYGSSGAYAFTICTRERRPYFKHPVLEQILNEEWLNLPQHFVGVAPDILVVMPEHIHGIIWIDSSVDGSPTLGDVIGGYKSITCVAWLSYMKETNSQGPGQLWQRSFYDHIIRNEQDLIEKRNYALNNPIVAEMKKEQKRKEQK